MMAPQFFRTTFTIDLAASIPPQKIVARAGQGAGEATVNWRRA
jgi:hypothetical protein